MAWFLLLLVFLALLAFGAYLEQRTRPKERDSYVDPAQFPSLAASSSLRGARPRSVAEDRKQPTVVALHELSLRKSRLESLRPIASKGNVSGYGESIKLVRFPQDRIGGDAA